MEFEWDPEKAAKSEEERGIPFEYAARVFRDPKRLDKVDDRKDYGEERRITMGEIEGRVFLVAYTKRGSVTRLISARKANGREQRQYIINKV